MLCILFVADPVYADTGTTGAICVINTVTGEILFEKDSRARMPMASTTKIMTLVTALENSKPSDIVTVSREASYMEGSSAYTKPGAKISMNDLCYGLMLNSGNDAAVAIAEHISGDTDRFCALMNETAKKIGAEDTHFVNPNGLHDDEHYTTAYDLAKITQYALKSEAFAKIVSTRMYTSEMTLPDGTRTEVEYINHNKLLRELDGCIGVKTGFTKNAGRCLVSAVNRDGAQYIAVTLNVSDDWSLHKKLHNDAIDGASKKTIVKSGDCVKHAVYKTEECSLIAKNDFSVWVNGTENDFQIIRHIPDKIDFELNKGEKVGYIEIKSHDNTIGLVDVVAEENFLPKGKARVKNCYLFTVLSLLRSLI